MIGVAEYVAAFQGAPRHGTSTHNDRAYIKTRPDVMDDIFNNVLLQKPNHVWQNLDDSGHVGGGE